MRELKIISLYLGLLCSTSSQAGSFHLRAREHYEWVQVKNLGRLEKTKFEGFTNTLTLWYEEPFRYMIGLAGSPLLATLPVIGSHARGAGTRIRLYHLGLEGKLFPRPDVLKLFVRGGVFSSTLTTRGTLGPYYGSSGLLGLGFEWPWHGVGLALEGDWRFGRMSSGLSFSSLGPAIGAHFYKLI